MERWCEMKIGRENKRINEIKTYEKNKTEEKKGK
jgi:hypothetical protein